MSHDKCFRDRDTLTDVQEIVAFFNKFLSEPDAWVENIEKILKDKTGLTNVRDEDLFSQLFSYLKEKEFDPAEIYTGILKNVFHTSKGETLRAVQLKAAAGEIGLRVGAENPYFSVINIGDVSGLIKLLQQQGIPCEEENITSSLFDRINDSHSRINILIGSRKFMEGWDSFRVASMGLMHIGRGEGSQIIQLFGRGVRLWGKFHSLKRSSTLPVDGAPSCLRLLETLNVFGVRANYMAQFRDYLRQEGIEPDFEEISFPVQIQKEFLGRGLKVLRLPEGKNFCREEGTVLDADPEIRVTIDLRPKVEAVRSDAEQEVAERAGGDDYSGRLKELVQFLDLERIYFDLLEFKQKKGLHNLSFTPSTLRKILQEGCYRVLCPNGRLSTSSFGGLGRTREVATAVLRKYVAAFYDRRRRAWEQNHLRLQTLTEDDPSLSFGSYTLRVNKDFVERIRGLIKRADELYRRDLDDFPNIYFDRHLYQPLLVSNKYFESTPPELNEGEQKFVHELRAYLQQNPDQSRGKEIFLLRNLSRGRGIGFFEASSGEGFYPDFILWLIEDHRQWIAFIDPHGLRHAKGGFNDPKIQIAGELKEMESILRGQCSGWDVYFAAVILAVKPYEEVRRVFGTGEHTREEFEEHNVFFIDDTGYIPKVLGKIIR